MDLVIEVSGVPGAGKTTAIMLITKMLREFGVKVDVEDSDTPEHARMVLDHAAETMPGKKVLIRETVTMKECRSYGP